MICSKELVLDTAYVSVNIYLLGLGLKFGILNMYFNTNNRSVYIVIKKCGCLSTFHNLFQFNYFYITIITIKHNYKLNNMFLA